MIPRHRQLAALAAGGALLAGVGCGSDDESAGEPLPQDAVAAIVDRLDEVQDRYDDGTNNNNRGACQDIEKDSYKAIDASVEGLPRDVDPDVRKALEESLSRLQELTREGCANVEDIRTEPETTPEPTPPPRAPVEPELPPEQTDTQEEPHEEQDKQKPKKDDGDGGGGTDPDGQGPPGQDGGGQPAPPPEDD